MIVMGTLYRTVAEIEAALSQLEVLSSYEQRKHAALMCALNEMQG